MMSGLLTGINRAFPAAKEYGFQFTESLDTLYMIVRLSQFSIGVQALSILFQIIDVATNPAGADRLVQLVL
jgi:ribosome biogenesis protein MAK21